MQRLQSSALLVWELILRLQLKTELLRISMGPQVHLKMQLSRIPVPWAAGRPWRGRC
jgi:hypothetical protein